MSATKSIGLPSATFLEMLSKVAPDAHTTFMARYHIENATIVSPTPSTVISIPSGKHSVPEIVKWAKKNVRRKGMRDKVDAILAHFGPLDNRTLYNVMFRLDRVLNGGIILDYTVATVDQEYSKVRIDARKNRNFGINANGEIYKV